MIPLAEKFKKRLNVSGALSWWQYLGMKVYDALVFFDKYISYDGSHYLLVCSCIEFSEITIQTFSLLDSLHTADETFVLVFSSCLFLNAFLSPYAMFTQKRRIIVVTDAMFDMAYIVLNAVRILSIESSLEGAKFVRFRDVVSLCYPAFSVSVSMFLLTKRLIAENREKRDATRKETRPSRLRRANRLGKSRWSLFKSFLKSKTAGAFLRLIYIVVLNSISCLFVFIIVKTVQQGKDCRITFGSCVWNSISPRIYLAEKSSLLQFSCASDPFELDISHCDADAIGSWLRNFHNIGTLTISESVENIDELAYAFSQRNVKTIRVGKLSSVTSIDWSDSNASTSGVLLNLLRKAPNLKSLNISGNGLRANEAGRFIYELNPNAELTTLDLSRNVLETLPKEIYSSKTLRSLTVFDASWNNLKSIGVIFGTFLYREDSTLRDVRLHGNNVLQVKLRGYGNGIPRFIFDFKDTLQYLDLCCSMNSSGTIPSLIGTLTNLGELLLYRTRFHGTIPTGKFFCLGLHFSILIQFITFIIVEIGRMTNLRNIEMDVTMIGGNIPSEIGLLTNLESVNFLGNKISAIPSQIGHLTNLQKLFMGDLFGSSDLSGTFPCEICRMRKLSKLWLTGAKKLHGSIPRCIPPLTQLVLDESGITGTIPSEISNLPLYYLCLNGTQLKGRVPPLPSTVTNFDYNDSLLTLMDPSIRANAKPCAVIGKFQEKEKWRIHSPLP